MASLVGGAPLRYRASSGQAHDSCQQWTAGATARLSDVASAQEHFTAIRATTGSRLASIDQSSDDRAETQLSLKATLSGLRDVDYAEASARFSLQLTAIEAAQKTMLRVQSLSLFDKL